MDRFEDRPATARPPAIVGHGDAVCAGDVVDIRLHVAANSLHGVPDVLGARILRIEDDTFYVEGDDRPHQVGEVGGDWWRTFRRHRRADTGPPPSPPVARVGPRVAAARDVIRRLIGRMPVVAGATALALTGSVEPTADAEAEEGSAAASLSTAATSPTCVTIVMSRAQWGTSEFCTLVPGAITLAGAAAWLHSIGVVSHSVSYDSWARLSTTVEFDAESCGSLPLLEAHGHNRAWGQLRALSVTGGTCNVSTSACYRIDSSSLGRDVLPSAVAPLVKSPVGTYSIVQFYRFVTGARTTGTLRWACLGADPRSHWTNRLEVYCFNDFQWIMRHRSSSAVVTDPATVAIAWGRKPASRG